MINLEIKDIDMDTIKNTIIETSYLFKKAFSSE